MQKGSQVNRFQVPRRRRQTEAGFQANRAHRGSMIPSVVAALCEELHVKFMELNVMSDDDFDGSEVD